MLDTGTVYRIFYRAHQGDSKQEIAKELRISRNCVSWHLEGRYMDEYPDEVFRRIRPFIHIKPKDLPSSKWIPLSAASYFFPSRPSPRTLTRSSNLKTSVVSGVRSTTRAWIEKLLSDQTEPEGLLLTRSACKLLRIDVDQDIVPAIMVEMPVVPWHVVHRTTLIQRWTNRPFITLTRADLVIRPCEDQ